MRHHFIITYLTLLCYPLVAQKQVHGTIVDDNGTAVFATIYTSSGAGTICDSLGNFSFEIPSDENTLHIQSLGYDPKTLILANNASKVNVHLLKNTISIDEVAVTAHQSIQSKSATSAFTTGKKEIAQLNPQNLSQVLQTKVGFTNKSGYQAPLTLRGMSGRRILVLRNGNRRFSSYPAGVMSHTINVYDLDRIEVEKGASSVLYGAGAMAGIINLVDKSPFREEGFNAKLTGGYGSINKEKNILACGGWSDGKIALKAGIRYRDAENFSYPNGEIAENSFYSDKDLFFTTGYQFSELQNLILSADIHDGGPWGKPVGFNGTDYMRVKTQVEKSNNYALKYKHDELAIFKNFEFNLYYSDEERELEKNYYTAAGYMLSYSETTYFSDYYYGSLLKGNIKINDRYNIMTGAELYRFNISTPTDVIDYIDEVEFSNRVSSNARSTTAGVFMQNNWLVNDDIKAILGLRYNYASVFEGEAHSLDQSEERNDEKNALSANAAVLFSLNEQSKLKINLARSFRMPETTELYSDAYTSNGILYGNPDLEAEYCYSVDASYTLNQKVFKLEVSPFFWYMDDMISKEEINGLPGTNYTYINIGNTRLFGGEIISSLNFKHILTVTGKLSLRAGVSYLNGTDISDAASIFDKGTPLDYIPPLNLKSDLSYSCMVKDKVKLNVALRATYYSEQKRLGESNYATPQYLLMNANMGLSFPKIKTQPSLNIALNNIMNKEYYCYLSYLPSEGRDIRIFLTFNLNK